jgi:hypothetical protein
MKNSFQTIQYRGIYMHLSIENNKQLIQFLIGGNYYVSGSLGYAKRLIRRKLSEV